MKCGKNCIPSSVVKRVGRVHAALRATCELANVTQNQALGRVAERAVLALNRQNSKSEKSRLDSIRIFAENSRYSSSRHGYRDILTKLSDFASCLGSGRQTVVSRDWELLMSLAAKNDRLVDDIDDWLREQEAERKAALPKLMQEYSVALTDAISSDAESFEKLVDQVFADDGLQEVDEIALVANLTGKSRRRLSSRVKRRSELVLWRIKSRDTAGIFSPEIR